MFIRQSVHSQRRVSGKPNCPRQTALEEQMVIILHYPIVRAVFIDIIGVPGCSFGIGKRSSDEPSGEGFNQRG